jgi:raffinose/stachyose/melibiose transport system permease protein
MNTEHRGTKGITRIGHAASQLIVLLVVISILVPVIWLLIGSLKAKGEFYMSPLSLPAKFLWQNYLNAWTKANIGKALLNSILVTALGTVVLLLISGLAAYSFARFRFSGQRILFLVILLGLMISPAVIVIPLVTILARLNLINTRLGIIITYVAWGIPFAVFLLKAFFETLPQEILDSARIDGCSHLGSFWRIAMPLARPGLFSTAIFSGIGMYNEFLFALLVLRDESLKTLPVALTRLRGMYASDYTLIMAGVVIATIPILVVFLVFNKEFMKGLTSGSLVA